MRWFLRRLAFYVFAVWVAVTLNFDKFNPGQYQDNYRERVIEAAERKMQGQQVTEVPTEARRGQVIDLMAALKASLEKRGTAAADSPVFVTPISGASQSIG